ncbi:MAG: class I SAM-dependent methyltransferase family protein [Patescibacteria group bacterium]|nr:class I SAM-dependent methyltransferase family protein [Patescibacteria group bacterium]
MSEIFKLKDFDVKEDLRVVMDNDNLGYEIRKWFYYLTLPVMWVLTLWVMAKKKCFNSNPKTNTFWFDGLSYPCRRIKENSGKWKSLDIIYHFKFGRERGISGCVSDYWIEMMNAQAVRNRLKLVTRELLQVIKNFNYRGVKTVKILSVASGSAESVLQAMSRTRHIRSTALLADFDQSALANSKAIAEREHLSERCQTLLDNVLLLGRTSRRMTKTNFPHIVEMVGLLDYFDDVTIISLLKKIYNILPEGGVLVTGHIRKNPEQYFLKWVINWDMNYRTITDLDKLICEGGFRNRKIILEPHGIHMVAVCRK